MALPKGCVPSPEPPLPSPQLDAVSQNWAPLSSSRFPPTRAKSIHVSFSHHRVPDALSIVGGVILSAFGGGDATLSARGLRMWGFPPPAAPHAGYAPAPPPSSQCLRWEISRLPAGSDLAFRLCGNFNDWESSLSFLPAKPFFSG